MFSVATCEIARKSPFPGLKTSVFGQNSWKPNCNTVVRIPMGSVNQAVGVAEASVNASAAAETDTRSRHTLQLVMTIAVIAALAFTFAPVVTRMARQWWSDPNFSHGFLVPLFSAFLVWQRRERLAKIPAAGSWTGALVLIFGLALLLVGSLGAELFLSRVSLLFVICGLIVMLRGWPTFREVFFPWAFLALMIPIPSIIFNQFTLKLQFMASRLGSAILPMCGVPVYREGNIIFLPAMPLEVAEACSGIRSLITLGALAIMYGYFIQKRALGRILLVVAALPIAIVANALRIVGTGVAVQYWDPQTALGFFHEFSGWVIFLISTALLLLTSRLLHLLPGLREEAAQ
jgi:exosortase A